MCFYRSKSKDEYKLEYNQLNKNKLKLEIKNCDKKYNKHCCMGISYGFAAVGSAMATCMSKATSAPATGPATVVSCLACIDNLNEANEYNERKEVINQIVKNKQVT